MEIEDTFSNLEEIKQKLEEKGFACRMAADDADEAEEDGTDNIETGDFVAGADSAEIERWEAELPDIGGKDEAEEDDVREETTVSEINGLEDADVIYCDLFKKETYVKTFIFQKEEEAGKKSYRLVGFCEAPMT